MPAPPIPLPRYYHVTALKGLIALRMVSLIRYLEKGLSMKKLLEFVVGSFVGGLLVVVPLYLAVLLLLKAMQSVAGLARPFAMLLPEWLPAEHALSLFLVLTVCFLIGVAVRTPAGRAAQDRIER